MYSDIRKLSVMGGKFKEFTPIEIFGENRNVRVIYGKNGTGKSTLTKSIVKNKLTDYPTEINGKFLDAYDNEIILTDEMKKNIFIFNEEYIENNVKFKSDGLKNIVILGKQNELDSTIERIKEKISKYEKRCEKLNNFEIKNNIEKKELWDSISLDLKGDFNWAGIDRKIRGNRQNTGVTEIIINDIIRYTCEKNYEELFNELMEKKKEYLKLSEKSNAMLEKIKFDLIINEDNLIKLLEREIKEKKLSERENLILNLVLNGEQKFYEQVKNKMKDSSIVECPYCFQILENEYREQLVKTLETIFDAEVEEYTEKLDEMGYMYTKQINLNLKVYRELNLNSELCTLIEEKIKIINSDFDVYKNYCKEKKENVFKKIIVKKLNLDIKIAELKIELKKLNLEISSYNKKINELSKFRDEVLLLNKKVACSKIINKYKKWIEKEKKEKKVSNLLTKIGEYLEKNNTERIKLENEKKNTKIAIGHINNALNYIFFSNNRLKIEGGTDNTYKLFSNGIEVSPSNISCGERNILALCYFFTEILNNIKEEEFYKNQILLVIDDPISSFDKNNKIGIFSYLKMQFYKITNGNDKSKILIFTHDLPTVANLQKILEELYKKNHVETMCYEIETDNSLKKIGKDSEYYILLNKIFNFANGDNHKDEIIIGNSVRRVLEAFSTFLYRKGIVEVSTDKDILSSLEEPYREYFQNSMYKLFLHSESHYDEFVKNNLEMTFYEEISVEEKVKICKDIISFMYLLNENHILSYMKDKKETIDKWCLKIKETFNNE